MAALENDVILLRALEPEDIELLYNWENDTRLWAISNTLAPFSRRILERFIDNQRFDITQTGQLRLIIEHQGENRPVGTLDLFEYDPINARAGVGIMIFESDDRGKGYAAAALELLKEYAFGPLRLHQLYCNVGADNERSIKLFADAGFETIGLKRHWHRTPQGWADEYTMQLVQS